MLSRKGAESTGETCAGVPCVPALQSVKDSGHHLPPWLQPKECCVQSFPWLRAPEEHSGVEASSTSLLGKPGQLLCWGRRGLPTKKCARTLYRALSSKWPRPGSFLPHLFSYALIGAALRYPESPLVLAPYLAFSLFSAPIHAFPGSCLERHCVYTL